jgi:hypothetical protein
MFLPVVALNIKRLSKVTTSFFHLSIFKLDILFESKRSTCYNYAPETETVRAQTLFTVLASLGRAVPSLIPDKINFKKVVHPYPFDISQRRRKVPRPYHFGPQEKKKIKN